VRKVLAKEPAARYRSAEHLGRILAGYREGASQATGFQPVAAPRVSTTGAAAPRERPRPQERVAGPDWQLWFVGAVAALAVLGLFPLWAVVYRTYTDLGQPAPTPVSTPIITAVSGTAIVPQLFVKKMWRGWALFGIILVQIEHSPRLEGAHPYRAKEKLEVGL
jgi:hypothetical protein